MTMFVTKVLVLIAFARLIGAALGITKEEFIRSKLQSAPGKDSKCHDLVTYPACESDTSQIEDDWILSGWFYHSFYKSCRPAYSSSKICKENQDLPKTREECEHLCGDPCIMTNGLEGICMLGSYCPVNRGIHWMPCGKIKVHCCPKISDRNVLNTNFVDEVGIQLLNSTMITRNLSATFYNLGGPQNKTRF